VAAYQRTLVVRRHSALRLLDVQVARIAANDLVVHVKGFLGPLAISFGLCPCVIKRFALAKSCFVIMNSSS
jgi:hypothetical protein